MKEYPGLVSDRRYCLKFLVYNSSGKGERNKGQDKNKKQKQYKLGGAHKKRPTYDFQSLIV